MSLFPSPEILLIQSSVLVTQSSFLSPDKASVAAKFAKAADPDCTKTGNDHQLSKASSMPAVEKVIESPEYFFSSASKEPAKHYIC